MEIFNVFSYADVALSNGYREYSIELPRPKNEKKKKKKLSNDKIVLGKTALIQATMKSVYITSDFFFRDTKLAENSETLNIVHK